MPSWIWLALSQVSMRTATTGLRQIQRVDFRQEHGIGFAKPSGVWLGSPGLTTCLIPRAEHKNTCGSR